MKAVRKLDYVSIEYVIPRCGINPSAHAVLNAPIYASSHDVHVRPFTTGYIHNLLKKKKKNAIWDLLFICVADIGLPAQKKKKKK